MELELAGKLENLRVIRTKKGNIMALAEIRHNSKKWKLVFFPKIFTKFENIIKDGNQLEIIGNNYEETDEDVCLVTSAKLVL